jgi:hypothetical protein
LRTGDGSRVPTTILHEQTMIKDVAGLAKELDQSTLLFNAIDVMAELRGLDHAGRDLRQNVALPGNYMEIAHKLLERVPKGPMRQHLLDVLSSESFEDGNKAESLPARCWGSFSAGGDEAFTV